MKSSDYNKLSNLFLFFFFVISFIEIIAEVFYDDAIVWSTKPFIIPFLFLYYFIKSKTKNVFFILALFLTFIANVLLIEKAQIFVIIGSVFALLFRIVIVYLVVKLLKKPPLNLLLIGAIPFVLIYSTVFILRYDTIDSNILFFLINAFLVIYLGGFSLGNYIESRSKTNYYLFISTVLFAGMQFVFLLKLFSEDKSMLYAFSMLFYVFAQFILTQFILLIEKKTRILKL